MGQLVRRYAEEFDYDALPQRMVGLCTLNQVDP
jgi:hypothetical protein